MQGTELAAQSDDDLGRANCIQSRGEVLFRLGRNDDALQAFNQAEELSRKVGDDLGRANCMLGQARIALSKGDAEMAFELNRDALRLTANVGHRYNIELGARGLFEAASKWAEKKDSGIMEKVIAGLSPFIPLVSGSEAARGGFIRFIGKTARIFDPEYSLSLLPAFEAALPQSHADLLVPVRLALDILAGKRPASLPDQPEEMRRAVDQFLHLVKQHGPAEEEGGGQRNRVENHLDLDCASYIGALRVR